MNHYSTLVFFFFNCVSFLNRTISSVVEQHLFSVNPTRGQSSGDCHLTPWPPASGVRTSARQRRRQRREQQEELLRCKERNRYNERSTTFLVDATSMQLFLGATHKRSCLSLRHKPFSIQDSNRFYSHSIFNIGFHLKPLKTPFHTPTLPVT